MRYVVLKLFKNNHEFESMIQRVYRQIKDVDPNAKITIATSSSQEGAIKNQLGDTVSLCLEPCRKDTFPAIALSVAYLYDKLGVDKNETVVVCPVDPYVDDSYFDTIKSLDGLVQNGNANLSLMGIEPSCPSEKYGYIIPENGEKVSKVREFKEKPDEQTAREYLRKNALWNAGIFAFKLSYLLDKAHKMIDFKDYYDLLNKYDNLTKISFDYAVVEHESSIQVLRYNGLWKDVGTWDMLAEVMEENIKGNVTKDESCKSITVVNELDIPVLCIGCKDLVVVSSPDGILVANKEQSNCIKPYVEKVELRPMYADEAWGTYKVINVQPGSITTKISIKAKKSISYHIDKNSEETWIVLGGQGKAIVDGREQFLVPGYVIVFKAGSEYTIETKSTLNVIVTKFLDCIDSRDEVNY